MAEENTDIRRHKHPIVSEGCLGGPSVEAPPRLQQGSVGLQAEPRWLGSISSRVILFVLSAVSCTAEVGQSLGGAAWRNLHCRLSCSVWFCVQLAAG